MAYKIVLKKPERLPEVRDLLAQTINKSRFKANLSDNTKTIFCSQIRLKESKHYCGNHAGPCQVRFGGEPKHRKMNYLEGLDWISFNNLVNNTLDRLGIEANVSSSVCIVRKGKYRRFKYFGQNGGEFDKDCSDGFTDGTKCFCETLYQPGTPGILE